MMTASGSGDARRSLSWRWWRWRAPAFISAALVWGCSSGAPRPEPVDQAPIPANAPSDVAPPSAAAAEVCAPGTTRSCMLREVTEDGYKYCHEDFELCLRVNVWSPFWALRHVLPAMVERGGAAWADRHAACAG